MGFIVVFIRPDLKTGYWYFLLLTGNVLTMTLQLYGISKNDAKKNPAEQFQRDVEKKEVFMRCLKIVL
jgi:hypothetical protein